MNCLGISVSDDRSAAAVVVDGRVVSVSAEDVYSRQLRDGSWPRMAIDACLGEAELSFDDVDWVGLDGLTQLQFTRVLWTTLKAPFPQGLHVFSQAMREWMGRRLWLKGTASKEIDIHNSRVVAFAHHKALATASVANLGDVAADILVIDTASEWSAVSTWHVDEGEPDGMRPCLDVPFPHSLGLIYRALCRWAGVGPTVAHRVFPGLAAIGSQVAADVFEQMIPLQPGGGFSVSDGWIIPSLLSDGTSRGGWTPQWTDVLGPPRDARTPWDLSRTEDRRIADTAASFQAVMTRRLLGLSHETQAQSGATHLCLAGDMFTDGALSKAIIEDGPYEHVSLLSTHRSEGAAIGAALMASRAQGVETGKNDPGRPTKVEIPHIKELIEMVPYLNVSRWARFRTRGAPDDTGTHLGLVKFTGAAGMQKALDHLSAGRALGWCIAKQAGRPFVEEDTFILSDPRDAALTNRVQQEIRGAPTFELPCWLVLASDASELFPGARLDLAAVCSGRTNVPWGAHELKSYAGNAQPCGVGRLWVVADDDTSGLSELLRGWKAAVGVGILRLHPFGEHGLPSVLSASDAALILAHTTLDGLVIGDWILSKGESNENPETPAREGRHADERSVHST